jgi:hypothetical protein
VLNKYASSGPAYEKRAITAFWGGTGRIVLADGCKEERLARVGLENGEEEGSAGARWCAGRLDSSHAHRPAVAATGRQALCGALAAFIFVSPR